MMRWIGILKFHGLYLWCGHSFNGWCCSRVWYIQTCHGSKGLIFSGLFCHSNLRSDTETSYENPTIETNYEYLRGDMETGITCHEAFSAAGRDPPCTPGPLITLQPDSIARQTPPGHSTVWYWATHVILMARAWEADSLRCASRLFRVGRCIRALICGYRIH